MACERQKESRLGGMPWIDGLWPSCLAGASGQHAGKLGAGEWAYTARTKIHAQAIWPDVACRASKIYIDKARL